MLTKEDYLTKDFKPRSLQESITWHEYALESARERAMQANEAAREAKRSRVEAEMAKRAATAKDSRFAEGERIPTARMVVLDDDDGVLRRLEENATYANSEVARLEQKLAMLRSIQKAGR